ncbi:PiggyBac transposable element-derived protein 4 [Plakobranchus ocellatus]|uniref:PiggyBac transposable element-derived protein 4 n=1 Tax=Plakobranchus ocellatus TaxID=259542 RepID=A0AAV4AYA1_9GAST|nr:PiggyBac transposable element-derived protein 4 [Plakobranchus ocellatus]
MHSVPERCETSAKSEIVLAYNKSKRGVNTMDQMVNAFTEKTKRWLLVVLFNIIDLSTNATRVIREASCSNLITATEVHIIGGKVMNFEGVGRESPPIVYIVC